MDFSEVVTVVSLKEMNKSNSSTLRISKYLENYSCNNHFLEKQKRTELPSGASIMQRNSERQLSQRTVALYTKPRGVCPPLIQKQYLQPCTINEQFF